MVEHPDGLEAALASVVGAALDRPVRVSGLVRLTGGASRETWAFDAEPAGGGPAVALVLRRSARADERTGMAVEAAVTVAAGAAGVPVAAVVAGSDDPGALGGPYLVAARVEGETVPRRVLRLVDATGTAAALAAQCADALAATHTVDPVLVPGLEVVDALERCEADLRDVGLASPAFELALRWLRAHRPARRAPTVVHGDFRMGNLIVGPDGLRAVLDWELAHVGDPVEDLAWLCLRAWRFGRDDLAAAGLVDVEVFVERYRQASGRAVGRAELDWWILLGTTRWGVICAQQAQRHLHGGERSVELAAIGRRVAESEWDALALLAAAGVAAGPVPDIGATAPEPRSSGLHDSPSAAELVDAVREWVDSEVRPAVPGAVGFHARVASNVLAIVARELAAAPTDGPAHAAALATLGVADEAELARRIRAGSLDERRAEVVGVVAATVSRRLAVDHPGWDRT